MFTNYAEKQWNIIVNKGYGVKRHFQQDNISGHGWLNELDSWITEQLIQAYHQYGVGSRPSL